MQIEHRYLCIYIESDGSLSTRNTTNVFQYSNDCSGVKMFCPYGPDEVMPYISVQLYSGSVLEERTMGYSNSEVDENGRTWYAYTYLFPETVTQLSGMRYSTSIYLAFRFEDIVNGQLLPIIATTTKVPVTVQPSLRGRAGEISDSEAANLQKQINDLAAAVSKGLEPATEEKLGGIKVGESLSILKDGTLSVDITSGQSPLKIALDGMVPRQLNILQHGMALDIDTSEKRQTGRIYIDMNGSPKYLTLEQVKDLNTKILNVDSLSDTRISSLSDGDYVFLRKE